VDCVQDPLLSLCLLGYLNCAPHLGQVAAPKARGDRQLGHMEVLGERKLWGVGDV